MIRTAADYEQVTYFKLRQPGVELPAATASCRDNSLPRDLPLLEPVSVKWDPASLLTGDLPLTESTARTPTTLDAYAISHLHMLYCQHLPAAAALRSWGALWELVAVAYVQQLGQARARALRITTGPEPSSIQFPQRIHEQLLAAMQRRPEAFVAQLSRREADMLRRGVGPRATSLKSIGVGPLTLRRDSWFLARPAADDGMWFGKVLRLLSHAGPDGRSRLVVQAQWHLCVAVHGLLRMPVTSCRPSFRPEGAFCMCEDVVAWHCWAERVPGSASQQVMVARSWSCLEALFGVYA
jgi:hypothetical protein